MSSLDDWSEETEKCIQSRITFVWKTGEMTVEFRTYVKTYNYAQKYVKKLLTISNTENRAVMLQTLNVLSDDIKTEYYNVMDEYEHKMTAIDNEYLFEHDREQAKSRSEKKINAKRKALNSKYEKILKLSEIVEGGELICQDLDAGTSFGRI